MAASGVKKNSLGPQGCLGIFCQSSKYLSLPVETDLESKTTSHRHGELGYSTKQWIPISQGILRHQGVCELDGYHDDQVRSHGAPKVWPAAVVLCVTLLGGLC